MCCKTTNESLPRGEGSFSFEVWYLGLDAKSAVLYNHWILGELFKQVLPFTRELAECAFGHEKYSPGTQASNTDPYAYTLIGLRGRQTGAEQQAQ